MTVECDGAGNTAQLNAWLQSHAFASASDLCSGFNIAWTNDFATATFVHGCGSSGYYVVVFTAADECGQTVTTSARFTIADSTGPTFSTPPGSQRVQCDGSGNTAALAAWEASKAGAVGTDQCGTVLLNARFNQTGLGTGCDGTGFATAVVTATDSCGNPSTATATFAIVVRWINRGYSVFLLCV